MKKIILLYFICSFSIYAQGQNFLANEKKRMEQVL